MLIKELQDLQRQHGYRPREALHDLTERLNVLFFEVYGVASFYPHLRFEPPTSTTICAGNVGQRAKRSCYEGEAMAEEDTRQLLRTFGVTVTNFEEHTAQLLEQAKQLRQAGDSDGMLTLLKDFAGELLDLQRRWLDITNHTLSQQRRVLAEIATLVSEWGQKSG
jgi:hypothetical protein